MPNTVALTAAQEETESEIWPEFGNLAREEEHSGAFPLQDFSHVHLKGTLNSVLCCKLVIYKKASEQDSPEPSLYGVLTIKRKFSAGKSPYLQSYILYDIWCIYMVMANPTY
jgi:hypothetical protein